MQNQFRTEIQITRSFDINYQTPLLFLGSCFSDHMGNILLERKFPVMLNPFGSIYNPASVAEILKHAITHEHISADDLIEHDSIWHTFLAHGSFSTSNKQTVLENVNGVIDNMHNFLKETKVLFVTFGTAWVFEWIASGKIVANCHKIPANNFKRYKLSVNNIVLIWSELIQALHVLNPELKVVFTVSPIRHLKDGLHENQLSKSTLLLAIDELVKKHSKMISYFPSYEIIQDDLRDYRFYAADMLHISDVAVLYIFEKFKDVYFDNDTRNLLQEVEELIKLYKHKILTDNVTEIEKFAKASIKKINRIEEKHPYIKFKLETNYFKNLI